MYCFLTYTHVIRLTLGKKKQILNPELEQSINVNSYKLKVPEPFNVSILQGLQKLHEVRLLMASTGGFICH